MGQGNPKSTMQVDLADLREQLDSLEDELPPPLPPTAPSPAGAAQSEAQAAPRPSSIPAPPEMNSSRIAVLVAVVVGSVVLALVVAQLLFGGEDPASTPSDGDSNAAAATALESGAEDLAEEDLPTIELGEIEVDDMAGEAENSAENNPDPENAASDGQ